MTAPPARCIGIIGHVALLGRMGLAAGIDVHGDDHVELGLKTARFKGNPDTANKHPGQP